MKNKARQKELLRGNHLKALNALWLLFIANLILIGYAAAVFPADCPLTGCTANDVDVIGAYIKLPDDCCSEGDPVTATLYFKLKSGVATSRYAIWAECDVYDGTNTIHKDYCLGDLGPGATLDVPVDTAFSWTCGQSIEIRNAQVRWSVKPSCTDANCGHTPSCSCYSNSKCGFQEVIVVASPQPTVTISPPSKLDCLSGSTVTLTATATGGSGGYTYQWYTGTPPSGTLISGATSSTYNAPAAGSYYVVVTTSQGCTDTSEPVTVENAPNPIATGETYTTLCDGTLTIAAPGVLTNDPAGTTAELKAGAGPTGGILNYLNADGSFKYTANVGTTSDSFTYKVIDATSV